MSIAGRDIDRAVEAQFERLQITGLRHRVVSEMAHGERQFVELAMVLAPNPRLVLLDEPAAGMTDRETDMLARVIREIPGQSLRHRGGTRHGVHPRDRLEVTVLNQGRILTEGPVEEVLADPRVRDVYLGKQVHA